MSHVVLLHKAPPFREGMITLAIKFFIRANPKMNRSERAVYLGVHISTIGKWLAGTRTPTKQSAVLVVRGIRKHRNPNPSAQLILDYCGQ